MASILYNVLLLCRFYYHNYNNIFRRRTKEVDKGKREKREIAGATRQGVPILEESYAHRRNQTDGDESAYRLHESLVKYARHEEPMLQGRGWNKDDEFRYTHGKYGHV